MTHDAICPTDVEGITCPNCKRSIVVHLKDFPITEAPVMFCSKCGTSLASIIETARDKYAELLELWNEDRTSRMEAAKREYLSEINSISDTGLLTIDVGSLYDQLLAECGRDDRYNITSIRNITHMHLTVRRFMCLLTNSVPSVSKTGGSDG